MCFIEISTKTTRNFFTFAMIKPEISIFPYIVKVCFSFLILNFCYLLMTSVELVVTSTKG